MLSFGRLGTLRTILLGLAVSLSAFAQSGQSLPDAPRPQQPSAPPPSRVPDSSSRSAPPDGAPTQPASGDPGTPVIDKPVNTPAQTTAQQANNTPDRDRLYKISTSVNFIEIPVSVKDPVGHRVEGLLPKDFTVYENGVKQQLTYFTSDPLPLSAAVLIDVAMSDTALRKVQDGLQALQGAFSQYDEVAVYTYGSSVVRESSFGTAGAHLSDAINRVVTQKHGNRGGVPMGGGPFEAGPTVNGHPMDPGVPQVPIIPRDRRVLNDAMLEAALDLAKVAPARRRVILVIGDGREDGSQSSYADTLKVLLTNKINVYAIAVGSGAIPVYRKLEQINVPGTGNANILPKYANATGGEVFPEFNRKAIEDAYAIVTVEARNQYTLGYYTQATLADNYREIEVRVDRPGLRVSAKAGYYPLPTAQR